MRSLVYVTLTSEQPVADDWDFAEERRHGRRVWHMLKRASDGSLEHPVKVICGAIASLVTILAFVLSGSPTPQAVDQALAQAALTDYYQTAIDDPEAGWDRLDSLFKENRTTFVDYVDYFAKWQRIEVSDVRNSTHDGFFDATLTHWPKDSERSSIEERHGFQLRCPKRTAFILIECQPGHVMIRSTIRSG